MILYHITKTGTKHEIKLDKPDFFTEKRIEGMEVTDRGWLIVAGSLHAKKYKEHTFELLIEPGDVGFMLEALTKLKERFTNG